MVLVKLCFIHFVIHLTFRVCKYSTNTNFTNSDYIIKTTFKDTFRLQEPLDVSRKVKIWPCRIHQGLDIHSMANTLLDMFIPNAAHIQYICAPDYWGLHDHRGGQLISTRDSSVHWTARLVKCTSAAGVDLYREAGTALQLFTRYHLLQHIPILLISNQFLQGYLSTWRGVGGSWQIWDWVSPSPSTVVIVNRVAFMPNRATRGYRWARVCMRRGNQAAGTQRISFCVALGAKEGTGRMCVCVYMCECVVAEWKGKTAVCIWVFCKYGKKWLCACRAGGTEVRWGCVRVCTSNCECEDTMT